MKLRFSLLYKTVTTLLGGFFLLSSAAVQREGGKCQMVIIYPRSNKSIIDLNIPRILLRSFDV